MTALYNIPQQIKSVADKYKLALPKSKVDMSADFWAIGNNWIIRHDALTKIAKQVGVVFHVPKVEVLGRDNFYGVAVHGEAELDGYKIWTKLKRSDSDVDAGVGGSIILDGTGPYKKLKGTECLYAVSFLKEIVFTRTRCSISNKLFEELKTQ